METDAPARLREYATAADEDGTDEGSRVPLAWLKEVRLDGRSAGDGWNEPGSSRRRRRALPREGRLRDAVAALLHHDDGGPSGQAVCVAWTVATREIKLSR